MTEMPDFDMQRHRFSLCNLANSFVFITGGRDKKGNPMPDCERLSITLGKVEYMPDLNIPRMYLASCSQGNAIYAICGYGDEEDTGKKVCFNSIEVLNDAANPVSAMKDWECLQIDDIALSPRNSPVAAPINDQEIAICGGYNGALWHGDLILFNTKTGEIKKIVHSDGEFCFYSYDNQSVVPYCNTVIALVQYPNR